MNPITAFTFIAGSVGRASDFNKIRDDLLALQSNQGILSRSFRHAYNFPIPLEDVTLTRYAGAYLPAVDSVLYTSVGITIIAKIVMTNVGAVAVQSHLNLPDSGGSSSISNGIFHDFIQPGETYTIDGPFIIFNNHSIRGAAGAASSIAVHISLVKITSMPPGINYFFQQPGTVPQVEGTFFTATQPTIVDNFIVANTNNANKDFYVRHVLNGQTTGPQHTIFKTVVAPFQTVHLRGPIHMEIGDMLRVASATDAASLGCRITPIEVL